MPDIVTITINPAIDLFVNVGRVVPERKLRCSAPRHDAGGGGINVARVAHRLGGDVAAIYPTGGAIGQLLQRLVSREGIESIVTPSHTETRENFTAFETETGEQYRFVLPGSKLHRAEWEAVLEKLASLPDKPRFVVASGSVPPGVPDDFFARTAQCAKKLGAKIIVDTSGPALGAALEDGVTLIKPNQNELNDYTGRKLETDDDRVGACRDLIARGWAEAVALTLGHDGAMLVTKEQAWRAQPMNIKAVSAVGAGDSFLGGMVAALSEGKAWPDAFRVAMAAGTAAVMTSGTELSSAADVKRLMPDVKIDAIAAAAS